MRLDKFLSNKGIGSRKEVKKYISNNLICVNDVIIKKSDFKISPNCSIKYNGVEIENKQLYYIMLNKPSGVVSSTKDNDTTVIDLIDFNCKNLFPVGRLDKDTVGLLLITNDGVVAHNMLSPKKHVAKTYYAKVSGCITDKHITLFKNGLQLSDFTCKPCDLTILSTSGGITEIEIKITEGKFHQVKRMFKKIGSTVLFLKRIKFGSLVLDPNLKEGEYRFLNDDEMIILKKFF